MDDKQCLDNARGQCDNDPDCYGIVWYPMNIEQNLKLCLSRDMEPKSGWITMIKSQGNHISIFQLQYIQSKIMTEILKRMRQKYMLVAQIVQLFVPPLAGFLIHGSKTFVAPKNVVKIVAPQIVIEDKGVKMLVVALISTNYAEQRPVDQVISNFEFR